MPGPGAYWIGDEERAEVLEVLESGHLSRYGSPEDPRFRGKVLTFEREFAAYTGARFCQATSSGTSTLLIALRALGVGPGDEVIVPTYTFVASYGAPIFLGAVPVLAEIDLSLCLDPGDIEGRITARTRAIMPVHILGNPCDMAAIMDIARRHGLPVVEDCCQACGASYRGTKVGRFGREGGARQPQPGDHDRGRERLARLLQHGPRQPPPGVCGPPLRPGRLPAHGRPPAARHQPQRRRGRRRVGLGLRHSHRRHRRRDPGGRWPVPPRLRGDGKAMTRVPREARAAVFKGPGEVEIRYATRPEDSSSSRRRSRSAGSIQR
ncbi:MAG: DegT/DnrJ/EryC1/StrS family aminotransferase [Candidatus Latescibacterota bacterium]